MSKLEQLRAMREAQAATPVVLLVDQAGPAARRPRPKVKTVPKKAVKKSSPKKTAGNGHRFKANKVKGRPPSDKVHLTNEAQAPWEAQGVSRRTWYRHQATAGK